MSCRELIDSLRKAADEKVLLIRREAESEAGEAKAGVARRLDQLRDDADRKRSAAERDAVSEALSAANNRARDVRLSSEQRLSARLKVLTGASLASLRTGGYEAVFAAMTKELPALSWRTVRVNPEDVALAGKYFPGAEIMQDPHITGGMDVSTEGGSIRVVNTFEKRLERAWSDMLPLLIKDVYREVSDGASAAS
jgi:vacuolar-type H+-ATPase subunit E/Vma4